MTYLSDQEQKQLVKNFWKRYGTYILVFVLAFLAGNFFWRYFRQYRASTSEHASVVYMQMLNAKEAKQREQFILFADKLMSDYKRSPYASLAAMFVASDAVANDKLAVAEKNLTWAVKHSSADVFSQMARIRLARVLVAENKNQQALDTLKNVEAKELLPLVDEVRGDVFMAIGNKKAAYIEYQTALTGLNKLEIKSPLLEMKLKQFPQQ